MTPISPPRRCQITALSTFHLKRKCSQSEKPSETKLSLGREQNHLVIDSSEENILQKFFWLWKSISKYVHKVHNYVAINDEYDGEKIWKAIKEYTLADSGFFKDF